MDFEQLPECLIVTPQSASGQDLIVHVSLSDTRSLPPAGSLSNTVSLPLSLERMRVNRGRLGGKTTTIPPIRFRYFPDPFVRVLM